MRKYFLILVVIISNQLIGQELSMNARLMTVYNLVGDEQFALALEQIEEILKIDNTIVNAHVFGGLCEQNLGNYKAAIVYFDRATELAPQNADVYFLKGKCYFQLEQAEMAEKSFETCLYYDNKYYKARIELAKIDRQKGDLVKAEQALLEVLKEQVYNLEARKELASLFLETQDTSLALNVISQALLIRPDDIESLIMRINILNQLQIHQGLMDDLNTYLLLKSRDSDRILMRGKTSLILGDTIAALRDFNDLLYTKEKEAEAYYYRAISRNALYDKKGACEDLNQAKMLGIKVENSLESIICNAEALSDE